MAYINCKCQSDEKGKVFRLCLKTDSDDAEVMPNGTVNSGFAKRYMKGWASFATIPLLLSWSSSLCFDAANCFRAVVVRAAVRPLLAGL